MTDAENEVHKLITAAIDTLRKDIYRQNDEIKQEVRSLRPCFTTKKTCDDRHAEIERRMVDKTYFAGGVAVLLLVIAILGVILAVMRF